MSAQIFEFTGGKLTPITSQNLQIGQRVRQAYKHEIGVIVEEHPTGYTVIFEDGDSSSGQRLGALSPYTRIELVDGIATAEEIAILKFTRDRKQEADRIARTEAKQQHQIDFENCLKELRTKYPWAIPAGEMSSHARAAKNLKIELAKTFPGVKFSVRSSSFSMGDDVVVLWSLGPTSKEVESVSGKYQEGHFDGMIDLYENDHSAYGEAVDQVLGRSKYVNESRNWPEGLNEQIGRDLCTLQHVEYVGQWTRNLCGENDTFDLQSHVNQLLSRTSFKAGEEYAGVEYVPNDEQTYDSGWVRIVKTAPAVKESPKQTISEGVTISENTEKNGIEIRFSAKPAADVLASLKANGWRWSRFNSCWYARASDEARTFAQQFAGKGIA